MTIGNPRKLIAAGRDAAEHAGDVRRGARALARVSLVATGVNAAGDLDALADRLGAPAERLATNAESLVDVARLFRRTDETAQAAFRLIFELPRWE